MNEWLLAFGVVTIFFAFYITYRVGYRKGVKMVVKEWKATLLEEDVYYEEDRRDI